MKKIILAAFLGATLGGKKATMEARRRVRGPFGGPKGLRRVPADILGVVWGSKRFHFEGSEPLDSIGRANEISIFRIFLDITIFRRGIEKGVIRSTPGDTSIVL